MPKSDWLISLQSVIEYLEGVRNECEDRYKLNYRNMEEARGKQYHLYKYNEGQYLRFLGAANTIAKIIKHFKLLEEKSDG